MGIAPIPGLCGVGPTNVTRAEREVGPALALNRCDRMQEDDYQENHEEAERGMEEESESDADGKTADNTLVKGDSRIQISFFA